MAKDNTQQGKNTPVDNDTLLENIRVLETEKNMLKEQKERAEKAANDFNAEIQDKDAKIKSLEEQIQKLTNEKNDISGQLDALQQKEPETQSNTEEIENLKKQLSKVQGEKDKADKCNVALVEENKSLKKKITDLNSADKGIILTPFIRDYLNALAEKLSKRYNKTVDPAKIIEDYIIRYNLTDKWTEWFHPWLMTDEDAVRIANKINPEVKTFNDLKKALNIA